MNIEKSKNIYIVLEHVCAGRTFAQIADELGTNTSQCNYRFRRGMTQLGLDAYLPKNLTPELVNLAVQRKYEHQKIYFEEGSTPLTFALELERERRSDERSAMNRRYGQNHWRV